MALGIVIIAVLNPLSVNIIADGLVTAINLAMGYIILASDYTMVVGGTLLAVGMFLSYDNSRKRSNNVSKAKIKKASTGNHRANGTTSKKNLGLLEA